MSLMSVLSRVIGTRSALLKVATLLHLGELEHGEGE